MGKPASIGPFQKLGTISGNPSAAHTTYFGWRKPARIERKLPRPGEYNRTKSNLQAVCTMQEKVGHFDDARPVHTNNRALPPYRTSMHLPPDTIMNNGTSLSKCSPAAAKLEKEWKKMPYSPRKSSTLSKYSEDALSGAHPSHPSDGTTPGYQPEEGQMVIKDEEWEAPRLTEVLAIHPEILLDKSPPRKASSLVPVQASLKAYTTRILPYEGDFLWTERDPTYRFLTPEQEFLFADMKIPRLKQPDWSKRIVSKSRIRYARREGNPAMKMDDSTNGFFDGDLESINRLEWKIMKREKKADFEARVDEARREWQQFKAEGAMTAR